MKTRFLLCALLTCAPLTASSLQAAPRDGKASIVDTSPADLLRAAASGDVTMLQSALKRGAPLEVRDGQYGISALGWAAWRGHLSAVKALLDAGADADMNSRSANVQIPVTLNLPVLGDMTAPESGVQTPLALAILGQTKGASDVMREQLRRGASPNMANVDGITPLMYAALLSPPEVVSALLARGADPNATDNRHNLSPLSGVVLRIGGENLSLVHQILAKGANPNTYFLQRPIVPWARLAKRNRTADLLEAASKQRLEQQIRAAKQPATLYPESNSTPTILE